MVAEVGFVLVLCWVCQLVGIGLVLCDWCVGRDAGFLTSLVWVYLVYNWWWFGLLLVGLVGLVGFGDCVSVRCFGWIARFPSCLFWCGLVRCI